MIIAVTGACGTLGRGLVKRLSAMGHEVIPIDMVHDADPRHVRADVADYRQLSRALADAPNMVFHLAAEFGRKNGDEYSEQLWRSNVLGTRNILRVQSWAGFRLVHFSSSEIYGEHSADSLTESLSGEGPLFPKNDYAISKWVNELQIRNERERNPEGETMVVRLFNAYGPGEHYHAYRSVVCLFCWRLMNGLPIEVFQGYRRAFMYVGDLMVTLANIPDRFVPGEVVNIGGSEVREVADVVQVIRASGVDFNPDLVTMIPEERHNVRDKRPDLTKSRVLLGHDPVTTLENGIPATLKWLELVRG